MPEPYIVATEQLVVEIFVRDLKRSIAFYQHLGFELVNEPESNFVAFTWEGHRLFLEQIDNLPPVPEYPICNVRVMVPDVDRYWALAQKLDAKVLKPIANRDYGLRDFTIIDPDGMGIRFGTYLHKTGGSPG